MGVFSNFCGKLAIDDELLRVNRTLQDRLVKELRLAGISDMTCANAFLPEYMESFNAQFAKSPLQERDLHRPLQEYEVLDDILSWQEERTVSNSLTLQDDRVLYLFEPNKLTRCLRRCKVRVYDFPDGTIHIRHRGRSLLFTVFDKVCQVRQADFVSNKRLTTALRLYQERQAADRITRSCKAPARRAQLQQLKVRSINPALLAGNSGISARQE